MPEVSVIIPVYNTEKYLSQCLESIQKQNYTDFEVIIVDDGSTDSSFSIYTEFLNNDNRFRCIKTENRGLSAARNIGIKNSKGDYICLIDSDDWVNTNLLSDLIPEMKKTDADISIFWFFKYDNNTGEETPPHDLPGCSQIVSKETALSGIIYETYGSYAWNKIYKRELFNGTLYPEEIRYCEDVATTHKLFLNAKRILLTNSVLYHYRINNYSSLTHNFNTTKCFDAFVVSMNRYNDLKNDFPMFTDKSVFYIVRSASFFFCLYKGGNTEKEEKLSIIKAISDNCANILKYKIPMYLKLSYYIGKYISPYCLSIPYRLLLFFKKIGVKKH